MLRRSLKHGAVLRGLGPRRGAATSPAPLSAARLTVERSTIPKLKPAKETLVFGQTFTDHMLKVAWKASEGWDAPRIVPFGNLSVHPAASSLHYALECFEGMKAYVDEKGLVRMFRPDMNMKRLNRSCERLLLPTFDGDEMQKCIVELIKMEREWIPKEEGYSLYVRPTVISTFPVLGVQPSQEVLAYVILSPVGPYYKSGFNPVKLYASPDYVRAWPGGTGFAKCGGNYAMTMLAQEEARRKGYTQVLWLYGDDHQVTEVGTMNQFFMWRRPGSKDAELVTAPLDGTILAGVTRDSILQLARKWGEFEVSERHFTMGEVIKAIEEGRMLEAFGCGTAAIVSPVESIFFTKTNKEYRIPVDPKLRAGPVAHRFMRSILDIQYGRTPHPWSVVID